MGKGNEDDYIIISVVRTKGIGFLQNLRRTNVMLTRCKRGMFIVADRKFLCGKKGQESLVGELATHCGDEAWMSLQTVTEGKLFDP